jgi:7,8-dihydropterin-6-yl-methyl-4-(beta-D-ribofuranosyl)aminobenzene 5'-phosphate synthase
MTGKKEIPLFLHPEAFLERRLNIPAIGSPATMPALDEVTLKTAGAIPIKSKEPVSAADGLIYVTGDRTRNSI